MSLWAGALVVWAVTAWSTRKGRLGALKIYSCFALCCLVITTTRACGLLPGPWAVTGPVTRGLFPGRARGRIRRRGGPVTGRWIIHRVTVLSPGGSATSAYSSERDPVRRVYAESKRTGDEPQYYDSGWARVAGGGREPQHGRVMQEPWAQPGGIGAEPG
jgi:hypothetical protein